MCLRLLHPVPTNQGLNAKLLQTIDIMTTLEPKTPPASSVLKVWSDKPPEEVRIFGLRGADIKAIWAPLEVEEPVCPDDRGFTSTNAHGLCKYCQLLLSP